MHSVMLAIVVLREPPSIPHRPPLLRPSKPPNFQTQETFFNIYPTWLEPCKHLKTLTVFLFSVSFSSSLHVYTAKPSKPGSNPPLAIGAQCSRGRTTEILFTQMIKHCSVKTLCKICIMNGAI